MQDDLTHTMVHDLRNPLTGISIALQLLDDKLSEFVSPAQHRLFEIANNSTEKMISLVNAILDLSRLEQGHMPVNPSRTSIQELVTETMRQQSPLAADKGVQLLNHIDPALPPALADEELVGRILQNLVGNAIKFTPSGGSISIRAHTSFEDTAARGSTAPEQESLCISVTDTGPGIPPELQDRLFEKFVVGEHEARGSGLGLAFCKLAVEAHGGRIWVENQLGQGASIAFTLPVSEEADYDDIADEYV
jgi:signal transduction histidine kinase